MVVELGSWRVPSHPCIHLTGSVGRGVNLLTRGSCCDKVLLFRRSCFVTPAQPVGPHCTCPSSDVIIKFTGANVSTVHTPQVGSVIISFGAECRLHTVCCQQQLLPAFYRHSTAAVVGFLSFEDGYQLPVITTFTLFVWCL